MIKAVFLDVDNTLLDFDEYVKQSMKNGFETFGLGKYSERSYEIFEKINNEMWKQIERGELTYEQLLKTRWNTVFAALGISYDGESFEHYFKSSLANSAIPVSGAFELLEYLKGKYVLCAASNGPYNQQLNRLKISGMLPYFDHVFVSEAVGYSKPSKGFFDYCFKEVNAGLKVCAHEIIMIGDSLTSDMAGAIDYGIKTIFFDKHKTGDANGLSVDYHIMELTEVKSIL